MTSAVEILREHVAYTSAKLRPGPPSATSAGRLGVSEATCTPGKQKHAHLGVSEPRRLRHLEDENARLKRLVADLTLDKHIRSEALRCGSSPWSISGIGRARGLEAAS